MLHYITPAVAEHDVAGHYSGIVPSMIAKRLVGRVGGPPVQLDHDEPRSIPHVAVPIAAAGTALGTMSPTGRQSVAAFDVAQVPPLELGMNTAPGLVQEFLQQRPVTVPRTR